MTIETIQVHLPRKWELNGSGECDFGGMCDRPCVANWIRRTCHGTVFLGRDREVPTDYHSAMATLLGLRTVIYPTEDLAASTAWWTAFLGFEPYFSEEFYVGFDVAGYELGLIPSDEGGDAHTYWGVEDVRAAIDQALEEGATLEEDANDVGEGIVVGAVITPDGSYVGFIENPNFGSAIPEEE